VWSKCLELKRGLQTKHLKLRGYWIQPLHNTGNFHMSKSNVS